jgi:hypothetical protein
MMNIRTTEEPRRRRPKPVDPLRLVCPTCDAAKGEPCRVTLLPEGRQYVSTVWYHRRREEGTFL